jgi:hypothetical protein
MNQQEFQEYYKKNKIVVIGVPVIVFVLLLDLLILKPSRQRRQEEKMGGTVAVVSQEAVPTAPTTDYQATDAMAPGQPEPVQTPVYPVLSPEIDTRFASSQVYPYPQGRNIFIAIESAKAAPAPELVVDDEEEASERPEITYHGFFTLGRDKVAILRFADELLITRVGSILKKGPFILRSVFPEKIVIADVNRETKEFEVTLSATNKD